MKNPANGGVFLLSVPPYYVNIKPKSNDMDKSR